MKTNSNLIYFSNQICFTGLFTLHLQVICHRSVCCCLGLLVNFGFPATCSSCGKTLILLDVFPCVWPSFWALAIPILAGLVLEMRAGSLDMPYSVLEFRQLFRPRVEMVESISTDSQTCLSRAFWNWATIL